jgi:hypothetical protein
LAAALLAALLPAGPAAAYRAPTGLLTGTVTASEGTNAAGDTVRVLAWPDEAVTNAIPAGGFVDTVPIGTGTTDEHGNYALTPDLTNLRTSYASPSGRVDVEVRVSDGTTMQDWFTTLDGTAQHINFDLEAQRVDTGAGPEQVTDDIPITTCSQWQAKEYITHRPEKFVNAYGRPHAPLEVSEDVGSTHSLGVALKIEGGGWGLDGSSQLETTSGAGGTQTFHYERLIYNSVNYRHWHMTCTGPEGHDRDMLKASGFYDLISQWPSIPPTTWIYCVTKSSGEWRKSQGSNVTFTGGVSLPYLSVSAHISFSQNFQLTWRPNAPVWLCGNTSLGWAQAPQAAAKKIETDGGCPPPGPCVDRRATQRR